MNRHRLSDDTGSTLPLVAFYAMFSLVLVLLVVAITSVYLERKRLFSLADAAALVGAEAFDLETVTRGEGRVAFALDGARVRTAVESFLEAAPTAEFDQLRLEHADALDSRSARVTLSARWEPPLVSALVPEGFRVEVTATARSVFG